MVNSYDGWIVGADGIYRWQQESSVLPPISSPFGPIIYLVIIILGFALAIAAWLILTDKNSKKQIKPQPINQ